ncbi:MAG: hypothetical protein L6425_03155 [Candidatus Aminicenantes bacterium]|nr:hypothetical protein [Candidatus Aminicenantes bacterium]
MESVKKNAGAVVVDLTE